MSVSSQFEAVVVGGGLAGSAAAILLARAGVKVAVIEQHAGAHHKVCGEFLSAEALHYLAQLGCSPESLGAVPITHVRLATGRNAARAALPFPALSLTRRTLDEALLHSASEAGARVLRGYPVEALSHVWAGCRGRDSCWRAALRSGEIATAPQAMLATGKHDLRGYPRPAGLQNQLVAFKQYFALVPPETAALEGHVELYLFPGGYAGLQPVELDRDSAQPRANLCLVVDQRRYRALGGSWPALLEHLTTHCPLLRDRLSGATPLLPKPLALSGIPYGLLLRDAGHASSQNDSGADSLWRLGDQTAVIPSFTGDGMSIALHTAFSAAECFGTGLLPQDFHVLLHETLRGQIRRATAVSQLLLTPMAQPVAALARPLLPAILRQLARGTRIPPEARLTLSAVCEKREKIAG